MLLLFFSFGLWAVGAGLPPAGAQDTGKAALAPKGAEDQPKPKDQWDQFDIASKFMLGLAGVMISTAVSFATYFYNKKQTQYNMLLSDAQDKRNENDLKLRQIDMVQKFFPQLTSANDREKWAAIALICSLGDEELAVNVGRWYVKRLVKEQDGGVHFRASPGRRRSRYR